MRQKAWLGAVLLLLLASGCVERRYVITSDPPGALVYRNNVPIGTTPVDDFFVYYGEYEFTLVKPGFETLRAKVKIEAPWYEYPPLDFVSENLVPYKIRDVREGGQFQFALQPQQAVRQDDVLRRAIELRGQGKVLGPVNPDGTPAPPPPPVPATRPGPIAPRKDP